MPPKATPIIATANRSQDIQNTGIKDVSISNGSDNIWFRNTLQQLIVNQKAFKAKLNVHNHQPVKMPSIKKFAKNKAK